ncbi:histidinol-phosphate transaminase [Eubacterium xylanophilum]|uniref:histidinol-phosphate transaminase n=1 Tax=Eubacterium xylanophilum TaxID=39497 RepID=UPI0004B884D1|nr:histidinol-phosphate transaminase [Eubacterium xylanophilum]
MSSNNTDNVVTPAFVKNFRKVTPYTPGEQPQRKVIKLNTNENPYGPAPGVEKVRNGIDIDVLRLYPELESASLSAAIAEYHGVPYEKVFAGVGSDDVLSMAFLTFFNSEKPIVFPDITYSFYPVWANVYKIPYREIPLKSDFTVDENDYFCENGGVVIANPNAPTSISMPLDKVEKIIRENRDVVVIIDEAYVDFGGETALGLVDKYQNLLVVRTFSKSRSMAGVRIGYAIGSEILIKALKDVKESVNSYTINTESIKMGIASIQDEDYFVEKVNQVVETRKWTASELEKLDFRVLDSSSNFLFASHAKMPAKDIFERLKEKDIFVRYFTKERIDNYLRITIGTGKEMELFIEALKSIIE